MLLDGRFLIDYFGVGESVGQRFASGAAARDGADGTDEGGVG